MTGGGAIAVAIIMALSPAASAASAGVVLHPGYKGVVAPQNGWSQSGCAKVVAKKWHLSLKTGAGGASSKGLAGTCKNQLGSIGQYSSASANGEVAIGIKLPHISNSATNVSANIFASWTASITGSDGGKSAACNNAVSTNTYNYTTWEWNNFANFAYTDNYSYNGVYYSYSYNVASVPSPFNLNNTTYYYHDSGYSVYASCDASAQAYADIYGYLVDLTTGSSMYPSGNGFGSNGYLFETFLNVYNSTDYGASQYYYWDEGSQYGSNNTTAFSYNTTLTSYIYTYVPTFSYNSSSSNTLTWSNSSSTASSIWWDGTFNHHDNYALELYAYADFYASNSWQHGYASWTFNMLTLGHGLKLTSISIT